MSSRLPGPCCFLRNAGAVISLIVLLLPAASGCGSGEVRENRHSNPAAAAPTRSIQVDGLGRSVLLPLWPQRIISLAPSVTETLFLLGAGERVVGVTTYCDWPDEARRKPKIGTLLDPNFEVILAARPDVVIASTAGNDRQAVLKLAELGAPVFVTAPRDVERIFDTVKQIARITGEEARGTQLVAEMKARIDRIRGLIGKRPPLSALFITWFEPLLAPGRRTFETDVLRLAGLESITADSEEYYPRYSLEQVLKKDPDVILTVRHAGSPFPDLRVLAGWKELRAVREGRVHIVSEVLQHPSPRFVDGLEEVTKLLYGEESR